MKKNKLSPIILAACIGSMLIGCGGGPGEKDIKLPRDSAEVREDTAREDNTDRKINPGAYGTDK
ncbi:MAG TPA: hypothetical protein VL947_08775 [Cytophagales bacterium]|nr:hypothetical protein [Cytophagales bacterium]